MTCPPGMCCGSETCLDTACQNHPDQPWNRFGGGRPLEQRNGDHVVRDATAVRLRMPKSRAFRIGAALAACGAAFIAARLIGLI